MASLGLHGAAYEISISPFQMLDRLETALGIFRTGANREKGCIFSLRS
jgi:hypothetical protein